MSHAADANAYLVSLLTARLELEERLIRGRGTGHPTGILGHTPHAVVVDEVTHWNLPPRRHPALPPGVLAPLEALDPHRCPHRPPDPWDTTPAAPPRRQPGTVERLQRHIAGIPVHGVDWMPDRTALVTAHIDDALVCQLRDLDDGARCHPPAAPPRPWSRAELLADLHRAAAAYGIDLTDSDRPPTISVAVISDVADPPDH